MQDERGIESCCDCKEGRHEDEKEMQMAKSTENYKPFLPYPDPTKYAAEGEPE